MDLARTMFTDQRIVILEGNLIILKVAENSKEFSALLEIHLD